MPERRRTKRPGAPDRRGFPRPPLWLNVSLLVLGMLLIAGAKIHRNALDSRFSRFIEQGESTPMRVNQVKVELAQMDLTREALEEELEARLDYIEKLQSDEFYIAIDTSAGKMLFYYGDSVVREADVSIGAPAAVRGSDGRQWTFVPLKGAFHIEGKRQGLDWRVPEWLYAMRNQPVPEQRPVIANGAGRYVIFLPNGYIIHSPPPEDSPLQGPKPGSFMVEESHLRAIWPRVSEGMRVFIF